MAQCMIFEEDEVSVENEKGLKYGLVLESSEYISSDEEDEENTYWDRVKKGSLRVAWHPDGEEEVIPEKSVKLTDRSLMPGDVVRRLIEGQDSQRGYVTNTKVMCHLQILGKSKVICDVNSLDLQFLDYWDTEPGDVYLDSWVGKIEKITQEITLKFSDGARILVDEEDFFGELSTFEDIHEKRVRDSEFAANTFYPGQRLKGFLSDLQTVKWLNSTKHHSADAAKKSSDKEVIATVEKVEPLEMEVHWLCQGFRKVDNPDVKIGPPSRTLGKDEIERLKKLDCFEASSVQIGDKAFYTLKSADTVHNFPQKGNKTLMHHILRSKLHRLGSNGSSVELMNARNEACGLMKKADDCEGALSANEQLQEKNSKESLSDNSSSQNKDCYNDRGSDSAMQPKNSDAKSLSTVNVVRDEDDDDEEEEENISDADSDCSGSSYYSANSNPAAKKKKCQHKKGGAIPTKILKKKKLKKSKKKEEIAMWEFKPGDKIACEVICTMSYVEVVWQDGSVENDIPSTELHPIHHLDELEFFPGDFVVPTNDLDGENEMEYGVVSSVDHAGRTCEVKWIKAYQFGASDTPVESICSEEVSVYDIKDHLDYKFRPGHVVVRVGGYEKQACDISAGQVFELCTDGRLLIQWADETKCHCYPQELYLIGDDLSELNSEFDSDEDSDSSLNSSEESWETEEETDVASGDEAEEEGEAAADTNQPETLKLDESAEKLFDVAITSLQYLEEFFSLPIVEFCQMECFREVLKLYKTCREVDRKLHASHFEEPKLKKVISTIKSEMKRERQAHFAKKVQELIARNQLCQSQNLARQEKAKAEACDPSELSNAAADISENKTTDEPDIKKTKDSDDKIVQSKRDEQKFFEKKSDVTEKGECKEVDDPASMQIEQGACALSVTPAADSASKIIITDIYNESLSKLKELMPESMKNEDGKEVTSLNFLDPTFQAQILDLCKDLSEELVNLSKIVVDQVDQSTQTANQTTDCGKCVTHARDLCQNACHLLRETIIKIRESCAKKVNEASKVEEVTEGQATSVLEGGENKSEVYEDKNDLEVEQSMDTECTETCENQTELKLHLCLNTKSEEEVIEEIFKSPVTPQTPAEVREKIQFNADGFTMLESAPEGHKFINTPHQPTESKSFMNSYRKELKLLQTSLPYGIYVKGFDERMDLFSVMIHGPKKTPYEDGLFFFEIKLPNDYPNSPPNVHYIAYCSDRLNPNLYEDGKVCVSLLGTWQGKGTEVWTKNSSFLQVLISIQGLILVSEPYYNEAGYEKQKGSQQGHENSRMYNEMALLKMVQSMTKVVLSPPQVFESEVQDHMRQHAFRMISRLEYWLSATPQVCGASLSIRTPSNSPDNGNIQPAATSEPQGQAAVSNMPINPFKGINKDEKKNKKNDDIIENSTEGTSNSSENDEPKHVETESETNKPLMSMPEYPLLPVSKGFALTLRKYLNQFRKVLKKVNVIQETAVTS